jgi:hypothetical protein
MEETFLQSAEELFIPVFESATVLGSHYADACGRSTVTAQDIQYGMMYAARNVAGKQVGTLFPEIYEDEDEDSDEEMEEVDEDEEPFTRYTGDDDIYKKMNECFDTWDEWDPVSPFEQALKKAVDATRHL